MKDIKLIFSILNKNEKKKLVVLLLFMIVGGLLKLWVLDPLRRFFQFFPTPQL